MERRSDMYISTLSEIIKAMGGKTSDYRKPAKWEGANSLRLI
jgi:hypothetical protein